MKEEVLVPEPSPTQEHIGIAQPQTQHTPGPWVAEMNEKAATISVLGPRADGNVRSADGLGDIVVVDCAKEPDAVMFSPMLTEQICNAYLMAAAPELLEALKGAVHDLETSLHFRGDGWECSRDELLGDYLAAIAKAEGQQ
ncbi:MAG: hypothetical protein ACM3W4_01680 [Ignavibacteriales bacterium]